MSRRCSRAVSVSLRMDGMVAVIAPADHHSADRDHHRRGRSTPQRSRIPSVVVVPVPTSIQPVGPAAPGPTAATSPAMTTIPATQASAPSSPPARTELSARCPPRPTARGRVRRRSATPASDPNGRVWTPRSRSARAVPMPRRPASLGCSGVVFMPVPPSPGPPRSTSRPDAEPERCAPDPGRGPHRGDQHNGEALGDQRTR